MTDPTVTVLTTTYNRAALLPRLHASLTGQSYRDFEWLVVDDGSTDDTPEVVAALAKASHVEVRYLRRPNGGKHAALNTGVPAARGRYCAVIDSDDWYEPDALSALIAEWHALDSPEEFAEVQALFAGADGRVIGSRFPCDAHMDSDAFEMFFHHGVRGDRIGMIRTDVLRSFPFPEDLGRFVTEALVWFRIAHHYKTRYVNRVLAHVDYQPEGLSRQGRLHAVERARMYHVFFKEVAQTPRPMPMKQRYRAYANWVRNGLLAHQPLRRELAGARSRAMFLFALPLGASLAARDRWRARDPRGR